MVKTLKNNVLQFANSLILCIQNKSIMKSTYRAI